MRKPRGKFMSRKFKKPTIKPGQVLGHLHIHQRVRTLKGSSGGQKWRVECLNCGKHVVIPQFYLVRQAYPKRDCGCINKQSRNAHTRERTIWYMMHRRCYNPTHVAYKHYGGANPPVTVCDRWNKDKVGRETAWNNFISDMGPAPTVNGEKYTLDRINPYGNYEPGNCRWASAKEQMNNLKRHWKKPEELEELAAASSFSEVIDEDTLRNGGDDGDENEDTDAEGEEEEDAG